MLSNECVTFVSMKIMDSSDGGEFALLLLAEKDIGSTTYMYEELGNKQTNKQTSTYT